MVDERRVRRLLQRVSEDVAYLRDRSTKNRIVLRTDPDLLAALKYRFVTAIEGCLNVAQHVCASEGFGPPSTNADAMRTLGRHEVLDESLSEALARAVGFRNLLVHGYVEVDDDQVVAHLDRVEDLEAFVASVSRWIR